MEYKSRDPDASKATPHQETHSLEVEIRMLKEKTKQQAEQIRSLSSDMRRLKNELRVAVNRFNLTSSGRS